MNPKLIELGKRVAALRRHFIQTNGLMMIRDIAPTQGHCRERLSLDRISLLSDGWFPDLSDEQTVDLLAENVRSVWRSDPFSIRAAKPGLYDHPVAFVEVGNKAERWTRMIHCDLTTEDELHHIECMVIALEVKASESCA